MCTHTYHYCLRKICYIITCATNLSNRGSRVHKERIAYRNSLMLRFISASSILGHFNTIICNRKQIHKSYLNTLTCQKYVKPSKTKLFVIAIAAYVSGFVAICKGSIFFSVIAIAAYTRDPRLFTNNRPCSAVLLNLLLVPTIIKGIVL